MPKVYNRYHNDAPYTAVYIGRGSPWGNPFPIDNAKGETRDVVCDKFQEKVEADPTFKARIKRELKGKDLVCYCAPRRCHGDYLLKVANEAE